MGCRHERILLVEDDSAVRSFTRFVLERSGYQVRDVGNVTEALTIWRTSAAEIDLLLTDITLPDGPDGRELVRQLKKERPDLKVVLFSGYTQEMADEAEALGVFLQKPFSLERLLTTVRSCLDVHQPASAASR